jgi:hypothetical protein
LTDKRSLLRTSICCSQTKEEVSFLVTV